MSRNRGKVIDSSIFEQNRKKLSVHQKRVARHVFGDMLFALIGELILEGRG
jgi:hypothetical protein